MYKYKCNVCGYFTDSNQTMCPVVGCEGSLISAENEPTKLEELKGIKRVLKLVDGYLSTQDQYLALAWDGGVMTYGELRKHLNSALKTKVLNDQAEI